MAMKVWKLSWVAVAAVAKKKDHLLYHRGYVSVCELILPFVMNTLIEHTNCLSIGTCEKAIKPVDNTIRVDVKY